MDNQPPRDDLCRHLCGGSQSCYTTCNQHQNCPLTPNELFMTALPFVNGILRQSAAVDNQMLTEASRRIMTLVIVPALVLFIVLLLILYMDGRISFFTFLVALLVLVVAAAGLWYFFSRRLTSHIESGLRTLEDQIRSIWRNNEIAAGLGFLLASGQAVVPCNPPS